jgi:putative ABC transport system substrate-binding protein
MRASLVLLVGLLCAAADATAQNGVRRIGVLDPTAGRHAIEAEFEKRLASTGWHVGKNTVLVTRYSGGKNDVFPALANELLRERPEVIVTYGTPASLAAKAATSTVPIIFMHVSDPVGVGLVPSLGRPGGNVTGISGVTLQLTGKRFELLRELAPGSRSVAVLLNPTDQLAARLVEASHLAGKTYGVTVDVFRAGRPDELRSAFEEMKRKGAGSVLVHADGMFWAFRSDIARLAAEAKLPAIYAFQEHVMAGGLASYGASFFGDGGMVAKAVVYVDRVLKGARPEDLPIQEPTDFDLVINRKSAAALGLAIPQPVLLRASRIIE